MLLENGWFWFFVSHMMIFSRCLAGLFCYVLAFSLVSYHIFAGCLFRWFAKSVISRCFRWFSVFVSDILVTAGSLAKWFCILPVHVFSPTWCLSELLGMKFCQRTAVVSRHYTPWKMNGWNIIIEVGKIIFLSKWVIECSMLIFQGEFELAFVSCWRFEPCPFRNPLARCGNACETSCVWGQGTGSNFSGRWFYKQPQNESFSNLYFFFPWCFWAFFFTMGQLGH